MRFSSLHASGATSAIISPAQPVVHGWKGDEKGAAFKVDLGIADAKPTEFDALLLPGGVRGADTLRADNKAVLFVHAMQIARKPIAAIRHGAQRHFECRWRLGEFGGRRGRVARDHPKAGPPVQRGDDRAVFAGKKCSGGVLATVA
ncbi:MAG: DJ-1/PfpI family protein [Candidatus Eremiobacteraeota bacterium]|nr:DJ-1/PfpI family protein [Candidatus Eremiobacteraeota bacterium]